MTDRATDRPIPMVTTSWTAIGRLHNAGERDFVPVRTSVGVPRWLGWAKHAPQVRELTPYGIFDPAEPKPEDEYRGLYVARLEAIGVEQIGARLTEVHAEYLRPLALLCFCDLHRGDFCHRRIAAEWWEGQTGQAVPEL